METAGANGHGIGRRRVPPGRRTIAKMDMELKDYFREMRLFTADVEKRLDERIDGVEQRLNERIGGVELRLNERIGGVELRLSKRMTGAEKRLSDRINGVERRMKAGFRTVDRRLVRMDAKLDVLIRLVRPERPS